MSRRLLAFTILGLFAPILLTVTPAEAKSFRIAAVQVEATLNPDASMRVVEHITYDFDGEFHNGTRPIPPGDYQIVDMQVAENGRSLAFDGAPYNLAWHYDAQNERRTFDISYTVLGAADVAPDVAELFWKFVGDQHPGVGVVRVQLDVPGDGLDVRAWAHGPLNGLVQPTANRVLFSVDGLPAGSFVEGRVTVPSSNFNVAPSGDERLPSILREEGRLADEANQERARSAEAERRRERILDVMRALAPFVAVAGWVVFILLFVRYGREYASASDVGEYLREPPDDPPAYVPTLFNWGSVAPIALSATIVDLAQRGYLTIEEVREDRRILPDKVDWKLTWKENDEPVRPFEYAVQQRLFAEGRETTQSEFVQWCTSHRTEALRWWNDVKAKTGAGFKDRRYIEGGKGAVYALNVLAALVVVVVGIVAVGSGAMIGIIAVVSGAIQLSASIVLRRRTPAGAQRLAEWKAFKRFLEDFSQLEDAPVGHLILWERYLVYAVALGVTASVARALAAKIPAPDPARNQPFAPWFIGMHGPGALDSIGSLSGFASGFGPVVVAAAQPPSSSSSGGGHGGGFSGGGGGGGGGGGIGAS